MVSLRERFMETFLDDVSTVENLFDLKVYLFLFVRTS